MIVAVPLAPRPALVSPFPVGSTYADIGVSPDADTNVASDASVSTKPGANADLR